MNDSGAALRSVYTEGSIVIRSTGSVIEGVCVQEGNIRADERGRLGEIMRADNYCFEKFGQVYYTTTYPGVVKAWHFHKEQTDNVYVVKGLLKVALHDQREDSSSCGIVNEVYLGEHCPGLLTIPPGVAHGWMCVSGDEAIIINVVTEPYNYQNPDEYRIPPYDNDIPYDWRRKDG
mgnify:CR=1 FL=1